MQGLALEDAPRSSVITTAQNQCDASVSMNAFPAGVHPPSLLLKVQLNDMEEAEAKPVASQEDARHLVQLREEGSRRQLMPVQGHRVALLKVNFQVSCLVRRLLRGHAPREHVLAGLLPWVFQGIPARKHPTSDVPLACRFISLASIVRDQWAPDRCSSRLYEVIQGGAVK